MKVIAPDPLLREAADVLARVRDDVVVIGASAVRVALDGHDVAITPTRDIDAGTSVAAVDRIVTELESAGLTPSPEPHEQGFTWVRGSLKVQLIRPFHPFPKGHAARLPVNNTLTALNDHRTAVAFTDDPETVRLWCADAAALVALKAQAFGRTRPGGQPVDRDFSDAVLLLEHTFDDIARQVASDPSMRRRVLDAATRLATDSDATAAAIRELVQAGAYDTPLAARQACDRATRRAIRELEQPVRED